VEHIKLNNDPCWFVLESDDKACTLHGEQSSKAMTYPDHLTLSCFDSEDAMISAIEDRDLICTHNVEEFT
jgi:hypothetical protein